MASCPISNRAEDPCGHAHRDDVIGDVPGHDGPGADDRRCPYPDPGQEHAVEPEVSVGPELGTTTERGARRDVGVGPDERRHARPRPRC